MVIQSKHLLIGPNSLAQHKFILDEDHMLIRCVIKLLLDGIERCGLDKRGVICAQGCLYRVEGREMITWIRGRCDWKLEYYFLALHVLIEYANIP